MADNAYSIPHSIIVDYRYFDTILLADLPGFEPGSRAPEAPMLSRLYYRSN